MKKHVWEEVSLHQVKDHWQCRYCKRIVSTLPEKLEHELCAARAIEHKDAQLPLKFR